MNWPATIRALGAAGCTISEAGRAILEGAPRERSYEALFQNGACVICDQPRTTNGEEAHAAIHLAHATAIVDNNRVIPTPQSTETPTLAKDFYRRVDPKLRRLALAADKRARKGTT